MKWVEWIIVAAIALLVLITAIGTFTNHGRFEAACDEAKGTTVWDGRQYQCIKPSAS